MTMRSAVTVFGLLLFLALVAWRTWSRRRKRRIRRRGAAAVRR